MRLPRRVEAVLLDMDGLLVDSERTYHDAYLGRAAELGLVMTSETFHRMIGGSYGHSDAVLRETFGENFDAEGFNAEIDRRVDAADIPLKRGAPELFDRLEECRLPKALVTSSSRAAVERRLGPRGLVDRLDALVVGGEVARGKPHPDPFLLAAERLGVAPPTCLVLEDSHNGVRAAHAAGMMAVMVPDLLQATEEIRGLCAHVASDLHEVCAFLSVRDRG
jgi:HAD superfamily hydrolase (TIGR01509 family)